MKKTELQLLWPFYVTAFSSSASSVALPVWMIFFQAHFSFLQISFALSLQSLASIMFEIPTGAIADLFGRKVSVVSGIVLQGLLWLVLPFIDSETILYFAFFLMGFLRTLESGADHAWMVDWLKGNKQAKLIQEMFIKINSLHSVGRVLSSLLATLLLLFMEIRFLFFVQGCGYILESALLFFFAREKVRQRRRKVKNLLHHALHAPDEGVRFLLKNKPLLSLVLATTFAVCSKDFGCIVWQPLLVDLSLPAEQLGMVFATASVIGIFAPFLSRRLLKKIDREERYLSFTTLIEFSVLASLYFAHKPFFTLGIVVYIAVELISDLQAPVRSMYFQTLVPSNIRATVGSVQSMIFAVFSCFVTMVGGYAMDLKGPQMAIVGFSLFLIPAGILYLRIKVVAAATRSGNHGSRRQPLAWLERWAFLARLFIASRTTIFISVCPTPFMLQPVCSRQPRYWGCPATAARR